MRFGSVLLPLRSAPKLGPYDGDGVHREPLYLETAEPIFTRRFFLGAGGNVPRDFLLSLH
jgi:hypothetical protein